MNIPWRTEIALSLSIVLFIANGQETTLAANQPVGAKRTNGSNGENLKNRNSCQPETEMFEERENSQPDYDQQINHEKPEYDIKETVAPLINLEPLQIRTFIATVTWY